MHPVVNAEHPFVVIEIWNVYAYVCMCVLKDVETNSKFECTGTPAQIVFLTGGTGLQQNMEDTGDDKYTKLCGWLLH
jgi:hypothetical protein